MHWWGLVDEGETTGHGEWTPRYRVVMAGQVFDVRGGRDNLIHCLVSAHHSAVSPNASLLVH